MEKRIAEIRKKLRSGKVSLGGWVQIGDATICEIFGQLGFDWVTVDMEHGTIDFSQLPDMFRGISSGGSVPFVRLFNGSSQSVRRALDAGALGVIIPNIRCSDDIREVYESAFYPPIGRRGVGFARSNSYGMSFDGNNLNRFSPIIVGMIESLAGVRHLHEILSLTMLDAILIGPYDLSASLGSPGGFDEIEFQNTINTLKSSCIERGVPIGIHIVNPDLKELTARISEGYTFIPYSMDTVILRHQLSSELKELNGLVGDFK